MWKRMLLNLVRELIRHEITEYVWNITPAEKQTEAIAFFRHMKNWMSNSNSSTTRAVARLLPFENN